MESIHSSVLIFFVNGQKIEDHSPNPRQSLADYLRVKLGLTGTKIGCNEGGCGACTVMISEINIVSKKIQHYSVNSCLFPLCAAHGKAVTTVEGIGSTRTKLHPVQERLSKGHGSQCGFCTPGYVMAMYSLLRNNPDPTLAEIDETLQGNLCRCTGYRPILESYYSFSKMGAIEQQVLKFQHGKFIWYRPHTLSDLLKLKHEHPEARIVQGNSEIGLEQKLRHFEYPVLIDPRNVSDLYEVKTETDRGIYIGSAYSISQLNDILKEAIKNLPAGATIVLESQAGKRREVLMDHNFFISYRKTTIEPQEIICGIWIPFTQQNEFFYGYKQAQRREDDIAIANAGMKGTFGSGTTVVKEIKLAFGGMAPKTVMALKTMKNLSGKKWAEQLLDEAVPLLLEDLPLPPGVPGGMERYRQTLCLSFFYKFFMSVKETLEKPESFGKEPPPLVDHKPLEATQIYQEVASGQPQSDPVHRPIMHLSGEKHTTGEAIYCDDINVAKAFHLYFVMSERAHAKIININNNEAMQMPGVISYIDWKDVPPNGNQLLGLSDDTPVFAINEVTFHGEPIGAVVAQDPETAQMAARKVKVEYEDLEPIITIEEAISKESFLQPGPWILSNHRSEDRKTVLDLDWTQCDHILEGQIRCGGQEHFYLEPQACIIIPKEDDEIEVISTTQAPADVQHEVSKALGIPLNKITVTVKRIGGGFGGKESFPSLLAAGVAVAAYKLHQPIRCVLERFDDMVMTGTRHPFIGQYKVGFKNDGKLLACQYNLYSNAGANSDASIGVMQKSVFAADNCYSFPQFTVKGQCCKTNLHSSTAMRGFGSPQSQFIMEEVVDRISQTLKMEPHKVREMNFYKEGERAHFGQALNHCNIQRCWDECKKLSDYDGRREQVDNHNRAKRWNKRGLALIPTKFCTAFGKFEWNQGGVLVHIYTDGSVLVSHGGVEMGQGLNTKIVQIAARTLNLPMERIHIDNSATDKVPNASPTAASVGSDLYGFAVKKACEILLARLDPYIRKNPKSTWEEWVKTAYLDRVSLSTTGFYRSSIEQYDWEKGEGNLYDYFVYGAACAEVEVDCLTGDHRLLRVDIVMDIGDSLNPAIDIGQIEGGFIQGYGLFTMEELKCSPNGILYTRGPSTYKIPSADDAPREFHVKLLQGSSNKTNIFSSKAVGEPPLFLGSSVLFAIKDAIRSARRDFGVERPLLMDSPATAEKIRMACQDTFTEQVAELPESGSFTPWYVQL